MTDSTERINMDELVNIVVRESGLSPCDAKTPYRFSRKQLLELIAYLQAIKHINEEFNKGLSDDGK